MSDRYPDFEKTNHVWAWVLDDQQWVFRQVHIDNAVAGDTDSIMLSMQAVQDTGEIDQEEMVAIADDIASLTNDTFPDFIQFAFNAPADRADTVQTAREIVSDKSFFLTKKRYIMHVVNDEGKPVDKLKTMGVELKRSDTSEAVKAILARMVDIILDGGSLSDLQAAIKEEKNRFYTLSLREIAKPSGCRTLAKYAESYRISGSMKGIPYQSAAALFYNSLCSNRDKRVMPGDKLGIIYIRHPSSKYLAFPLDEDFLPPWVDDLVIDYDVNWEKAYKKINNYLSAMGWDVSSRQQKVASDLFGVTPKTKGKRK